MQRPANIVELLFLQFRKEVSFRKNHHNSVLQNGSLEKSQDSDLDRKNSPMKRKDTGALRLENPKRGLRRL